MSTNTDRLPVIMTTISDTIRDYRSRRGMTIRALGAMVGVTSSYISTIENGKALNAAPDKLAAIADALGLELVMSLRQPKAASLDDAIAPADRDIILQIAALLRRVRDPGERIAVIRLLERAAEREDINAQPGAAATRR